MPFTFLIVDDEQLSRNYIRNMIREFEADARILEADGAGAAASLLAGQPVDVLFLDIRMSGTDGFGLLEQLPTRDFELVFITAYSQYAIRAIREGACDYLLKPIKKAEFKKTLQRVLGRRAALLAERQGRQTQAVFASRAGEQLDAYIRNIREQQEEISRLQARISQLQALPGATADGRLAVISQLRHNTILTEEDWQHFRELFASVYPHFFTRLRERFEHLTQAEVRLLTLTRLRLSTREMAAMLGISPETVRQTRWRLRKKIDLPEDMDLTEVVARL